MNVGDNKTDYVVPAETVAVGDNRTDYSFPAETVDVGDNQRIILFLLDSFVLSEEVEFSQFSTANI